jgi:hypothetical protein
MLRSLTDDQFREAREGCRRFIEDDSWEAAYVRPLTELYESLNSLSRPNLSRREAISPKKTSEPDRKTDSRLAT